MNTATAHYRAWNVDQCDTVTVRAIDGYRAACSCGWRSVARRTKGRAQDAGAWHVSV